MSADGISVPWMVTHPMNETALHYAIRVSHVGPSITCTPPLATEEQGRRAHLGTDWLSIVKKIRTDEVEHPLLLIDIIFFALCTYRGDCIHPLHGMCRPMQQYKRGLRPSRLRTLSVWILLSSSWLLSVNSACSGWFLSASRQARNGYHDAAIANFSLGDFVIATSTSW